MFTARASRKRQKKKPIKPSQHPGELLSPPSAPSCRGTPPPALVSLQEFCAPRHSQSATAARSNSARALLDPAELFPQQDRRGTAAAGCRALMRLAHGTSAFRTRFKRAGLRDRTPILPLAPPPPPPRTPAPVQLPTKPANGREPPDSHPVVDRHDARPVRSRPRFARLEAWGKRAIRRPAIVVGTQWRPRTPSRARI